ncbi:MAG: bifunctional phosphoglucose/phosphomannose isomerase [Candidatus Saccharimonadales bacterium]
MLDDLKHIHQIDVSDALGFAGKEPEQLLSNYETEVGIDPSSIANVVYAGMGGSALAGSLSQTWPGYRVPFEVVRNYSLPSYVSASSLCIVSSASGNTEETLSALEDAQNKGAKIVVIAGGGKLVEIAREKSIPLFLLPPSPQPRYGVFNNLKALVNIGAQTGIFRDPTDGVLEQAAEFLKSQAQGWEATKPVSNNYAKQMAQDCLGKSIVIYGGPLMAPAAYKWKISFNENAKQVAWCGTYSEFNHNEFVGWTDQPVDKPYCVIDLRSDLELPRIQARFKLSQQLLSGRRPDPIVVNSIGSNVLEQLLYCVLLGDFVSIYAAIAAGTNPEPVELVEKFKQLLAQNE